jgi:undecaprenyl-phosphate galactose phosphotransferase/putative colanic acid biosynthesis UDP-glucose lipid carrier transferase
MIADFSGILSICVISGTLYHRIAFGNLGDIQIFLATGAFVATYFCTVLAARGKYTPHNLRAFPTQARDVSISWVTVCALFLAFTFALKTGTLLSRGATLAFFAAGLILLLSSRWVLSRWLVSAVNNGALAERNIIIVGEAGELADASISRDLVNSGYRPIRTLLISNPDSERREASLQHVISELIELARTEKVDEIFLAINWNRAHTIEQVVHALRVVPLPVRLLPDKCAAHFLSKPTVLLGGVISPELQRAPLSPLEQAMKRTYDIVAAGVGLILLSPLFVIVMIMIKLDSPGSPFFIQTRNGFNGRSFQIFKFRTMTVREDGAVIRQATKNDQRVTRVGRFLRKSSIDELPQLLNVLKGDMSVVGPRPHATSHTDQYQALIERYALRHHVKPGITGLAQVNGFRGETPTLDLMEKRVELDISYINKWSLWLDIKITLKTVGVLAFQSSAY